VTDQNGNLMRPVVAISEDGYMTSGSKLDDWEKRTNKTKISEAIYL
jgi:hypothetical protein